MLFPSRGGGQRGTGFQTDLYDFERFRLSGNQRRMAGTFEKAALIELDV